MNRALGDVIGKDKYYTQTATTNLKIKSQDGSEDIDGQAYTYRIDKAEDKTQIGKYGLTTTYEKEGKSYTDTFIGTQGEVLVLLKNLKEQGNTTNPPAATNVQTKSYSDEQTLQKNGNKIVDVTAADKAWTAAGGNTVTEGTTEINKWDALGEETNQKAKPELSTNNLTETDKKKVLGNVDDNIELTFNEPVKNPDGIELWDTTTNAKVPAQVTPADDSNTPNVKNTKVIIDPDSPLTAGGKYEVRNSGGTKLSDLAVTPNEVASPVINFETGGTTTTTAPVISNTNLGSIDATAADAKVDITFDKDIVAANADGSISIKVNGADKTLASSGYTITGKTLSINKAGIDALGITNTPADNKLIVNADQIADATDKNKKNVATGELALKTEAPAATDTNPDPLITTAADTKFDNNAPIELSFENPARLVSGKALDSSTVTIEEIDDNGSPVSGGVIPEGLTYEITSDGKLKITPAAGKSFTPEKRYKIVINTGILQKDDGNPYGGQLAYTFKTKTPTL